MGIEPIAGQSITDYRNKLAHSHGPLFITPTFLLIRVLGCGAAIAVVSYVNYH